MARFTKKEEFLSGILNGDTNALSQAITLVESTHPGHKKMAQELLKELPKENSPALRLGLSGTPGVGKSTFIAHYGLKKVEAGKKIAVLAIDPSGQISGGSILGDKTRMGELASHPNAFIRPIPSGESLGGVSHKTREAILLCESFGMDEVWVETVGVGQNETAVASMVDFYIALMAPAGGDDLQGIKRGILELVDLIIINKADGDYLTAAQVAKQHYTMALSILRAENTPQVLLCSSTEGRGIDQIEKAIQIPFQNLLKSGDLEIKRAHQLKAWLRGLTYEELTRKLRLASFEEHLEQMALKVSSGQIDPFSAAEQLAEN